MLAEARRLWENSSAARKLSDSPRIANKDFAGIQLPLKPFWILRFFDLGFAYFGKQISHTRVQVAEYKYHI